MRLCVCIRGCFLGHYLDYLNQQRIVFWIGSKQTVLNIICIINFFFNIAFWCYQELILVKAHWWIVFPKQNECSLLLCSGQLLLTKDTNELKAAILWMKRESSVIRTYNYACTHTWMRLYMTRWCNPLVSLFFFPSCVRIMLLSNQIWAHSCHHVRWMTFAGDEWVECAHRQTAFWVEKLTI